jgi:hypothetical protein
MSVGAARTGWLVTGLLACVAWGSAATHPAVATAAVYWEGGGTLGAANLDGSGLQPEYVHPPSPSDSDGPQCGIAVSASYLYWVGSSGIGRVNLEGPTVPKTILPGLQTPCGIGIDGAHVYWASQDGGSIGRANLDGSEPNPALITGLRDPCGVAVDANYVYWLDFHGVGRARLDGSDPEVGFIPGFFGNCTLAVNAQYIYWGDFRSIGRASLDGSGATRSFITGLGEGVAGVATDGGHIYWRDRSLADVDSSIGRASLDGSEVNRQWIPTQPFEIDAVAVDGRPSPPALALAPLSFEIRKVSHDVRAGAAVLTISTSEPGELKVNSPGLNWRVLGPPEAQPGEALTWHLRIWAGKSGYEARRIARQLKTKGRAPLIAHVFYDGEIHPPVTLNRRLVLRKYVRPHRARVRHAAR